VIEAVRALEAIGDPAAAAVLAQIVADAAADPILKGEAARALSGLATGDGLDLMLDLLSDSAPVVRGAARRALARIDPDTFLSSLSGLDIDPDWTVRAAEASALALIPASRAQARLQVLLKDSDVRVVAAALATVASAKASDAEAVLTQHLAASDVAVRAASARGLQSLKASAAVPRLVEAYRASLAESTFVARGAIVDAVAGIDAAAAGPLLEQALRDPEWAVRLRAAALLNARETELRASDTIRPAVSREMPDAAWRALVAPVYSPHAYIETNIGVVEVELAVLDAPRTVANFMALARQKFFDGLAFHRVVADFVVQTGDNQGDGEGGPGYAIRDELNMRPYLRGTVGMALDGKDTGGSQFFITHSPQPHLDGRYTAFGHVVAGMDVVDRLMPTDVIRRVRIWDGVTPE